MRLSGSEFRQWDRRAITLLGMSGVGKTRLARTLRRDDWFHYSGDYRIGTRYLDEEILDDVKRQAMTNPLLRDLLRSDSIHIANNLTVDNLRPLSTFLGKVGNPEQGGIGLREFKRRQELHRRAEISAMLDVPEFIRKAHEIYGYSHFINDAGGSLCELNDESVLETLSLHTVILYIEATDKDEAALKARAESEPKPMYYPSEFFDELLDKYRSENNVDYVAVIDPDDFVRWVFPRLFAARIPRYRAIARRYGYTITSAEVADIETEKDFLGLVETVLNREPN